jgi:DDE family transposase
MVLTDRGLYAPWRFWRIVRLGWHPFVRINTGGTFRPAGTRCLRPLKSFVPQPGMRWRGRGTAFQNTGRQVECTRWALWEDGEKAPWLILTALPPAASEAAGYGLRAWIEQGFKITTRAGWQWHRTRLRDPDRAARLWLAVAVATLGWLSVGEAADETMPTSTLLDVTALCPGRPRTRRATRLRLVSVLRQGWVALWVALLRQEPLPQGAFVPEPWPAVPPWGEEAHEPALALPQAA